VNKPPYKECLGKKFLGPPFEPSAQCFFMSNTLHLEQHLQTLGGRVTCNRCQARSKRTGLQCRAPAIVSKSKCRFHGGKSTGPKTESGRQRCAAAKTTHGQQTSSMRTKSRIASAELALLESVGFEFGFIQGKRTRGRKPNLVEQVLPELHGLVRRLRSKKPPFV